VDDEADRPLAGIRVLDFSQMIAGPAASLWLADYGAEVLKVEPPSGDGGRALRSAAAVGIEPAPLFAAYNRDKTAIRLDLRDAADRTRAWELLAQADVVLESSLPGAMERLGFGADAVRERFPRIVYASVSGFGAGPLGRDRRGVDLIVQAESGMMSLTGYPGGTPTKVGFTVVDAACGHALCHGILAALFRRERTGAGGTVRISLLDVALNIQGGPLGEYLQTGVQPPLAGNSAPHTAPADVYETADGHVVMAAYLDPHWRRLVEVLDDASLAADPQFATPGDRVAHRSALTDLLAVHFRRRTTAEWLAALGAAGVLCAAVNDLAAVVAHPLVAESGLLIDEGGVHGVRSPVRLSGCPPHRAEPMRTAEPDGVGFGPRVPS
jgi:crotonobetainyl-CoA:carnitine CoA-transferase CaiB-like acyl-CoA transferase